MNVRTRGLHLLALSGFAIAQPLFDLLAREAEFFVARGAGAGEIFALVAALLFLPSLCLLALERLAGFVSSRIEAALHLVIVSLLAGLTAIAPLLRIDAASDGLSLALAAVSGALFGLAYSRYSGLRGFTSVLGLAPFGFCALFLVQPGIRSLAFPGLARDLEVESASAGASLPIVFVVFDELPISSLLSARNEIDATRFPAFARLAATSTWFRSASTVADMTPTALPAILTGRYPATTKSLPTRANHPRNLFSLLEPAYDLHVVETRTLFREPDDAAAASRDGDSLAALFGDVSVIYLHLISPEFARAGLPSISRNWLGFWDALAEEEVPAASFEAEEEKLRIHSREALMKGETGVFRRFVRDAAERASETDPRNARGSLHFLHTNLPHSPWRMAPDGTGYSPSEPYGLNGASWRPEAWWSIDAYRRHLMQVGFSDHLLGELIDALDTTGLWDEALVVVTADHGVSFWPGSPMRSPIGNRHAEDILNVPLFIKAPGQRDGTLDNRLAETIDIVPSIADLLGIEIPWPIDGCSLFSDRCPERDELRVVAEWNPENQLLKFDPRILQREQTSKRRLSLFGTGERTLGLFHAGPHRELLGRSIEEFEIAPTSAGRVVLERASLSRLRLKIDNPSVLRMVGLLEIDSPSEDAPIVVISIDARIEAIVPAPSDGRHGARLAAMLPPQSRGWHEYDVRVHLLEGEAPSWRLIRLDVE